MKGFAKHSLGSLRAGIIKLMTTIISLVGIRIISGSNELKNIQLIIVDGIFVHSKSEKKKIKIPIKYN
jgi:hypothetical protein